MLFRSAQPWEDRWLWWWPAQRPIWVRPEGQPHLQVTWVGSAEDQNTGREASFAWTQGARRVVLDTLVAVGGFSPATTESLHTVVEAVPEGWWYRVRLPEGDVVRWFFVDSARPWLAQGAWEAALRRAGDGGTVPSALRVVPASTTLLDPLGGDDWVAVGDAASTLDPISCAGITRALRSAGAAIRAIEDGDVRTYIRAQRRSFEAFLEGRMDVYAAERRFAAEPFWRRRHPAVWMAPDAVVGPFQRPPRGLTRAEQDIVHTFGRGRAADLVTALTASGITARRALMVLQDAEEEATTLPGG